MKYYKDLEDALESVENAVYFTSSYDPSKVLRDLKIAKRALLNALKKLDKDN